MVASTYKIAKSHVVGVTLRDLEERVPSSTRNIVKAENTYDLFSLMYLYICICLQMKTSRSSSRINEEKYISDIFLPVFWMESDCEIMLEVISFLGKKSLSLSSYID